MTADYCEKDVAQFDTAVRLVTSLPKNGTFQPSNDLKLRFYAYYKQATCGPCQEEKPAFWDPVRRAKWQAWKNVGGMSKQDAMKSYVDTLHQVVETMEYTEDVQNFLVQLNSHPDLEDVDLCRSVQSDNQANIINEKTGENGLDMDNDSNVSPVNNDAVIIDGTLAHKLIPKSDLVLRKSRLSLLKSPASDEDIYIDASDVPEIEVGTTTENHAPSSLKLPKFCTSFESDLRCDRHNGQHHDRTINVSSWCNNHENHDAMIGSVDQYRLTTDIGRSLTHSASASVLNGYCDSEGSDENYKISNLLPSCSVNRPDGPLHVTIECDGRGFGSSTVSLDRYQDSCCKASLCYKKSVNVVTNKSSVTVIGGPV